MIELLKTAGYMLVYGYAFYMLYILAMAHYRAYLAKRLNWATKILGAPILALAIFVDWFSQYTIATLIFRDWPRKGEWLVTTRLKRYLREEPNSWRGKLSQKVCDGLLDGWDATGDHC